MRLLLYMNVPVPHSYIDSKYSCAAYNTVFRFQCRMPKVMDMRRRLHRWPSRRYVYVATTTSNLRLQQTCALQQNRDFFHVNENWKKLLLRTLRLIFLPARWRRDREPNCDASRLWLAITSKLLDVGILASRRGMTTGTEELR